MPDLPSAATADFAQLESAIADSLRRSCGAARDSGKEATFEYRTRIHESVLGSAYSAEMFTGTNASAALDYVCSTSVVAAGSDGSSSNSLIGSGYVVHLDVFPMRLEPAICQATTLLVGWDRKSTLVNSFVSGRFDSGLRCLVPGMTGPLNRALRLGILMVAVGVAPGGDGRFSSTSFDFKLERAGLVEFFRCERLRQQASE